MSLPSLQEALTGALDAITQAAETLAATHPRELAEPLSWVLEGVNDLDSALGEFDAAVAAVTRGKGSTSDVES